MGDNGQLVEFLVQMSKLALAGKKEDARLYIARIARKMQKMGGSEYDEFLKLAQASHTRNSPLRNANFDAIPIDKDSRNELLYQEYPVLLKEEVVLNPHVMNDVSGIIKEYENLDVLQDNNLEPSKSVVFTGPPGVGKTLTARLIAHSLGLPLLVLDLSTVMSSFLGRTGNNIKNVFNYAKGMPCVLLLDEIDTIAKRRDDSGEVGELKRLVNVLLQEIDNWPSNSILIAATNHPDLLDPAIWRRFDKRIEFPKPSNEQISEFLSEKIKLTKKDYKLFDALVDVLEGESFSELNRLANSITKSHIIFGTSVHESLIREISSKLQSKNFDKNKVIKFAVALKDQKIAERAISEMTGLARDTIRKHATSH